MSTVSHCRAHGSVKAACLHSYCNVFVLAAVLTDRGHNIIFLHFSELFGPVLCQVKITKRLIPITSCDIGCSVISGLYLRLPQQDTWSSMLTFCSMN